MRKQRAIPLLIPLFFFANPSVSVFTSLSSSLSLYLRLPLTLPPPTSHLTNCSNELGGGGVFRPGAFEVV